MPGPLGLISAAAGPAGIQPRDPNPDARHLPLGDPVEGTDLTAGFQESMSLCCRVKRPGVQKSCSSCALDVHDDLPAVF